MIRTFTARGTYDSEGLPQAQFHVFCQLLKSDSTLLAQQMASISGNNWSAPFASLPPTSQVTAVAHIMVRKGADFTSCGSDSKGPFNVVTTGGQVCPPP